MVKLRPFRPLYIVEMIPVSGEPLTLKDASARGEVKELLAGVAIAGLRGGVSQNEVGETKE